MSSHSSSSSNSICDKEDLLQIEIRCKELKKEKDALRESQSESFELIRSLESHVKSLSESRAEDRKRILELEIELSNCCQEIDYLQDQLHARDTEICSLTDHINRLKLKLIEEEKLEEMVRHLSQELKKSKSECLVLMDELRDKEVELQRTTLCVEKLEESISSSALEYQCEIESMKLDIMALEQSCLEATKLQEEAAQENARISKLVRNYEFQVQGALNAMECLEKENKHLKEKLKSYETHAIVFLQNVEEKFPELLANKKSSSSSSDGKKYKSLCGDILGELFDRMVLVKQSDADYERKMEKLTRQVHEYELLVSQLKEQLREEKLKAKEEAEDLAQEMAELRFQITGLLEDECKRRACVEQISLLRISELEAQIEKERRKQFTPVVGIPEP